MTTKKSKRIKRVFSSADQVLHLWANQSQNDALELFKKLLNDSAKPCEAIGSFHFDSKRGDTVRIGCHVISFEQAKQVLTQRMKSEVQS